MRPVRELPFCPAILDETSSTGVDQVRQAIEFYDARAEESLPEGKKRPPGFTKFSAYRDPTVRGALNAAFGDKCAYCESPITAVAPTDVEHYRPKGGVSPLGPDEEPRDVMAHPHYFWLASTWTNLLPSCLSCNRATKQHFEDGSYVLAGKGNQFPLEPDSTRADIRGAIDDERPLLLNPYFDDPVDHLRFNADGTVDAAVGPDGAESLKGRTTIDVLGLNRSPLVAERKRILAIALYSANRIVQLQQQADLQPRERWFEWQIASETAILGQHLRRDAPYSMAVAQVLGLTEQAAP